jgi:23S rRNA (cytosine1962-C5)-methyltransferase
MLSDFDNKLTMFRNRLTKVYKHIGKQARRQGVCCYRVYDHDLPEFPLCIEFYGDKLYVAEYKRRHGMTEDEHDEWMEASLIVVSELLAVPKENMYLKLRQRKEGRLGQYQKVDEVKHEFEVEESGLRFLVNLSDYLDTGLFLDHRTTRQLVRQQSAGKRVLNLFAYTGSFSVYAAAGGASSVVTADMSKTYLGWAQRNMALNGFTNNMRYTFEPVDVVGWLPTLKAETFDLIVMDPPTFSNSKRMDDFLDIQRDHVTLINQCLRILTPGGQLWFSTNLRSFTMDVAAIQSSSIKDMTRATTPFDFEGRLYRWCYQILKI